MQCSWCSWQGLEFGPQAVPAANADETNSAMVREAVRTSLMVSSQGCADEILAKSGAH